MLSLRIAISTLFLLLLSATPAFANVQYTYWGNTFAMLALDSGVPGDYTIAMRALGRFEVASPLAPNLTLEDISGDVLSFSYGDGRQILDSNLTNIHAASFRVSTDALGNPIEWEIIIDEAFTGGPGAQAGHIEIVNRTSSSPLVRDRAELSVCIVTPSGGTCSVASTDYGQILNNPGPLTGATTGASYDYTGNHFTTLALDQNVPGDYTISMQINGSLGLALALAPNLTLTDITAIVLDFSFDDGRQTLDSATTNIQGASFRVSTDASGMPTEWEIVIDEAFVGGAGAQAGHIETVNRTSSSPFVRDRAELSVCIVVPVGGTCSVPSTDYGQVSDNAGTLVLAPALPALGPGALTVLATLLVGGAALALRQRAKV